MRRGVSEGVSDGVSDGVSEGVKKRAVGDDSPFFVATGEALGFDVFLDGKFAAVVTAFGTNVMHHDLSTTVAACSQLRGLQAVMRSSLSCSRLREPVFWMWHNY